MKLWGGMSLYALQFTHIRFFLKETRALFSLLDLSLHLLLPPLLPPTRHHMSPLLYACQNSRVSLSQLLISVNADVNKQDSRGWAVRGGGGRS